MAEYEGQIVPVTFIQARIIDSLNNFKGFDGKGYFFLGKSYIANFVTFYITILVILVQFKISEVSYGSNNCCECLGNMFVKEQFSNGTHYCVPYE